MPEIVGKDLQAARKKAGFHRWQAANEMNVSESVIARWETDEVWPDPDQVYQLEKLYNAPGLWHGWMRSHYESYREMYPEAPNYQAPMAVMNVRHQLSDVIALQDAVERDVMDGTLDDPVLKARYLKELDEAQAAIVKAKEQIK